MPVISATWEVEKRGSQFEASLCKNVNETPSQPISQEWWYVSVIPTLGGIGRRIAG
jgi:hypothetical protein